MMRRYLLIALFVTCIGAPAFAQKERESPLKVEEAESSKLMGWKWANFAVLAIGLGYVIAKKAPAFFNERSEDIQAAIKEATGLKIEADFRASEMDRKMATLSAEIQKLREEARAEMQKESQRIEDETRQTIAKLQASTSREIESLRKQADWVLREHAVRLAVDLAITRLRNNPKDINQDELVHAFSNRIVKGVAA